MATNSIIEKVNGTDSSSNRIASTFYCTCSTAAATAQKDATPSDSCVFNDSCLITGVTVHVKFTNSNTHATPTLKVGTATAKQIMKYGTTKPGTTAITSWQAGSVVSLTYDGTYWQMNDHLDDTTNTNTDSYISAAGFDWGATHDEVTMSLTRSGTSPATITANIPKFNDQRGGTVPKGESVSTQSQSTKFLRSDGSWAAPSYTSIPSNNVTGSGTSGYLVKWNGTNTITNGPALGNGTDTYLRNDGTWQTPTDTNNAVTQTNTTNDNYYKLLFSGTADNTTRTEGARKSADLSFNPSLDILNAASVSGLFSDIKTQVEDSASKRWISSINCCRGNKVDSTPVSHNSDTRVDDFYLYPGTWLVMCGVYFSSNATGSRWMYVNDDPSDTAGKTQLIDDLDAQNVGYLGRASCAASTNSGTGLNVNFMLTVTETRHIYVRVKHTAGSGTSLTVNSVCQYIKLSDYVGEPEQTGSGTIPVYGGGPHTEG